MATVDSPDQKIGHKNEKVGQVVSAKMQKTIVVEVTRRVPHTAYKRIINKRKKFYAHDEQQTAQVGDVVRIIECRPISKLKRWRLGEVLRKAVQVAVEPGAVDLELVQSTAGSKSLSAKGTRRRSS
jgi:small subunit ribosomal protein S17